MLEPCGQGVLHFCYEADPFPLIFLTWERATSANEQEDSLSMPLLSTLHHANFVQLHYLLHLLEQFQSLFIATVPEMRAVHVITFF